MKKQIHSTSLEFRNTSRETKLSSVSRSVVLTMLAFALMLTFSTSAFAFEDEFVTVRFTVNTSTIPDTVRAGDLVQIRGNVNGSEQTDYYGQVVNWGSSSIALENAGGDYWVLDFKMKPGDKLTYKIYTGKENAEGAIVDHAGGGWEANNPSPDTNDYIFELPADTEGDVVLPVIYYNRVAPFEAAEEGKIALFFRVNVGAQVATGAFNPDTDVVGVRGNPIFDWGTTNLILDKEAMPEGSKNQFYSGAIYVDESLAGSAFKFKYVFGAAADINTGSIAWDNGNDAFNPDGDGNNQAFVGMADTTYAFKFFEGRRPPSAEIVTASLQFAVNVGVLERLGLFNRAVGDEISTPGAFNNWNSSSPMVYNEAFDVWTAAYTITEEVGANLAYKYFVRWDESRREETSPNYIANLPDAGWEEPGITGGGNRIYTFTNETNQTVDDFGSGIAYYNGIPPQGVITQTLDEEFVLPTTFRIDMTPALSHTDPFDPDEDELYLILQTPIFALTQGLPIGTDILDTPAFADRVRFSKVEGQTNIFELTMDLLLPTENHIGFTILYVKEDGTRIENGDGFDAGRRYYRYVTPFDDSDPNEIFWPTSADLNPIEWKWRNLDWESPPEYGLGNSIGRGDGTLPTTITLHNNYPNPFNPTTNISFTLPVTENVQLDVYNVLGQRVATLLNQQMTAGTHTVAFDARNLASGVYIYQLRAGSFVQNKTMMLVK